MGFVGTFGLGASGFPPASCAQIEGRENNVNKNVLARK
jgi:hypothetical protein